MGTSHSGHKHDASEGSEIVRIKILDVEEGPKSSFFIKCYENEGFKKVGKDFIERIASAACDRNLDILYKEIRNNATKYYLIITINGVGFIKEEDKPWKIPRPSPGHHVMEETLFKRLCPNEKYLKEPYGAQVRHERFVRELERTRRDIRRFAKISKLRAKKEQPQCLKNS